MDLGPHASVLPPERYEAPFDAKSEHGAAPPIDTGTGFSIARSARYESYSPNYMVL